MGVVYDVAAVMIRNCPQHVLAKRVAWNPQEWEVG